jgi:hypothetical protein
MNTKIKTLLFIISFFAVSSVSAQRVETSKGKVEFIGLEKWTPALIQEKLGYESTDSFHFCAADLKSKLKFADASVTLDRWNGKSYTIITVVEPEYKHLVNYRPTPTGTIEIPASWQTLTKLIEEKMILNEILDYGSTLKNAVKNEKPVLENADTSWWKFLRERRNKEDFQIALKTLTEDKEFKNRAAAALILTNFADRDAAWIALMEAVRDKDSRVNSAALQSLITLTKYVPRKVNWTSAAPTIRHILNGTNLFALQHTIWTLLKTEVSLKLAKEIFKDSGGRMLFIYLRAENDERKQLARELLKRFSGKDFGTNEADWRRWAETI